jgi:RNase P subunit RPR2
MNCWHCNTKLIWANDFDIEDENDDYCMETNLTCPECGSFVVVYLPRQLPKDE